MEITEFEPERTMAFTMRGPMTTNSWARFAAPSEDRTELTLGGEIPGMDDSMEAAVRPLMERSAATIKSLVESES